MYINAEHFHFSGYSGNGFERMIEIAYTRMQKEENIAATVVSCRNSGTCWLKLLGSKKEKLH